jgi:arylsulfatase A-like enzyme
MKNLTIAKIIFLGLGCIFFGFKVNTFPKKNSNNTSYKKSNTPNVIVIMVDDLGYQDVSFNGSTEIQTPNIDRIANEGVKCTSAYVTYSVCGPSRAGFITGRYSQRFGFERNPNYNPNSINPGLPLSEYTIAETLPASYTTGIIGKWHLGAHPNNHPLNRGFDEFYGHLGGGHRYFPDELTIQDSYAVTNESDSYLTWIMKNHTPVKTDQYLTDEFSEEAVHFIQKHATDQNPFFLFLSYNAPHGPLQATQKYLDRFPSLSGDRKTYAAMVSAVDDGVGAVLDQLITSNIDENTIVFFLSDNGGKIQYSKNNPLRGGKSSIYEGGFRVPFAVQYKGTITPGVFNKPVSALDIYATTIAVANATQDPTKPIDGVNLIPYLTNTNTAKPHPEIYLRKFDQQRYSVQKDGFKLVSFFHSGIHELYDLNNDIAETSDIFDSNPAIVDELISVRQAWTSQLIDPIFTGITSPPNYASASPSDYLVNHNFELGNSTGWNNWNNGTTNNSNYVKSGNYAGVIKKNKLGSLKHIIDLKPNTNYHLKFWYASEISGETAKIVVKDEVTNIKFLEDDITTSTTYKNYDQVFTTVNTKNQVSFSVWKNIAANSNLYADDFEIIEVDTSPNQLRIKIENSENLAINDTYQAKVVEIPLTSWLGPKSWEIIDGTGTATVDSNGLISTTSQGNVTLKVSVISDPTIYDEIELTIGTSLSLTSENKLNNSLFSIVGSNIVDDEITIETYENLHNVRVQIVSLSGVELYSRKYQNMKQSKHLFRVPTISKGLYFFRLKTPDTQRTIKFIKQ